MSGANPGNPCQILVAAAALIDERGSVLVQRRRKTAEHGDMWEFPGGKIEQGETPEMALVRELKEELGIHVDARNLTPAGFSSTQKDGRNLLLLLYALYDWKGEIEVNWAEAIDWCPPEKLATLTMPPADVPLIAQLQHIVLKGQPE